MLICLSTASTIQAQDDPEYRMEIGVGAGLSGYLGDFNGNLTKNLQPMATVLGRYVFNPKGIQTYYPAFASTPYEFNNTIYDVCFGYEYNFWPYGTGRDYRGAKRLTPFVFGGIGATYVDTKGKDKFTFNIPIGIGMKYKLNDRVNLGVEWAMHFTQSDELDGAKDPYNIKSSGLFKNTDCYSALQLTLTYSFMAKCKTCNKE